MSRLLSLAVDQVFGQLAVGQVFGQPLQLYGLKESLATAGRISSGETTATMKGRKLH